MIHLIKNMNEVFNLFDKALSSTNRVVVAYSGGKDSTAVALLLRDWLESRGRDGLNVLIINSDTLSEIPEMRNWTLSFMERYVNDLRKEGINASYKVVFPRTPETFYWRVLIRGYPAPSFNFRWCVYLLKRKPALEIVRSNDIVLLGHRDEESSARTQALNSRSTSGFCPLSGGRCSSFYLSSDGKAIKIYPIRRWKSSDVWIYLKMLRDSGEQYLNELFKLYGLIDDVNSNVRMARFGCWHCTLVKYQFGNLVLGDSNLYFEAVRLIYRWISDLSVLRAKKTVGYSSLGYLLPPARSLMLHAIKVAEELSGKHLYGLDEARIRRYTLRQILYELPANKANRIIKQEEIKYGGNLERVYKIEDLRNLNAYANELNPVINLLSQRAKETFVERQINEIISHLGY